MNGEILDSKGFSIIEFQPKYSSQVKSLVFGVLKEFGFPYDPNRPDRDADLDQIDKVYQGRSRFWLVLDNSQVVGTVAIREIDGDHAEMKRMFVVNEYRRKGVGSQLLEQAIVFARQNNFKELELDTSKRMLDAHRFYENHGFKKTKEDEGKYYYQLKL